MSQRISAASLIADPLEGCSMCRVIDVQGGEPTVTLRHRIRGKLQKLPVAMPAVIGGCWQKAEFAKLRVMAAVLDVPGPNRPVGLLHRVRQSGRSGMPQHTTADSLIADGHASCGMCRVVDRQGGKQTLNLWHCGRSIFQKQPVTMPLFSANSELRPLL